MVGRLLLFVALASSFALTSCGGGSVAAPPSALTLSTGPGLSPPSLALSTQAIGTFNVQDPTTGLTYAASADPTCGSDSGGIFVAGDGVAQPALADTAVQFTVYAFGTTAAACNVTVTGSDGSATTLPVTYDGGAGLLPQSTRRTAAATLVPDAQTLTRGQRLSIVASGFTGPTTVKDLGCETSGATGISISPKQIAAGNGTYYIAAYGQGAVNKTCEVHVVDSAHNVASALTISMPLNHLFSATPRDALTFMCLAASGPTTCALSQTVKLHEGGAGIVFSVAGAPNDAGTCRYAFTPQIAMNLVTGGGDSQTVAGPSASITLSGYLYGGTALGCHNLLLADNSTPPQTVTLHIKPDFTVGSAAAQSAVACTGTDPNVRVPGKPHGMYVWNVNHFGKAISDEIAALAGKDPTLCGASFVINWADVNGTRGMYNWKLVEDLAAPYVAAHLRVNLLFADGAETGPADVTPTWVTDPVASGGDGVPSIACAPLAGQPAVPLQPYYPDATFEADWATFIKAAVAYFSSTSSIAQNIGYMRFGQGFGTEAEPGHGYDGGTTAPNGTWSAMQPDCQNAWYSTSLTPALSPATWEAHSKNIVTAIAAAASAAGSTKQMMIALNGFTGDTSATLAGFNGYTIPNDVSAFAAANGIGFGTENIGDTSPATSPCGGTSTNLYWCGPVNAPYASAVPIEFQPITATTTGSNLDISTLLPYALSNHAQILELYPSEWLAANGIAPSAGASVPSAATQAKYKCALYSAALVLGVAAVSPPVAAPC